MCSVIRVPSWIRTLGSPYSAFRCRRFRSALALALDFRRSLFFCATANAVAPVFLGAGIRTELLPGTSSITELEPVSTPLDWPDDTEAFRASCAAWNFCAPDMPPLELCELCRGVSDVLLMAEILLALLASRCRVTGGAMNSATGLCGRSRDGRGELSPGARLAPPEWAPTAAQVMLPRRGSCFWTSGIIPPSVISESWLTAMEVLRTSSSISAMVASSSSSGWSVMVTVGIHRFQSFQVSVFRRVRKTRDAGALILVQADTYHVASDMGMSGVEKSVLVAAMLTDVGRWTKDVNSSFDCGLVWGGWIKDQQGGRRAGLVLAVDRTWS